MRSTSAESLVPSQAVVKMRCMMDEQRLNCAAHRAAAPTLLLHAMTAVRMLAA